jgi:hypothetical protein
MPLIDDGDPRLSSFFKGPLPVVLLRADAPDFTILDYNAAYKDATYTHYRDITGWYLWEAFDPRFAGGDGAATLVAALDLAVLTKEKVSTPVFQYNIPADQSGALAECWWQLEIIPFLNNAYEVTELMIITNKLPGSG